MEATKKTTARNYYVALSPQGFANVYYLVKVETLKEAKILEDAYAYHTNWNGLAWRVKASRAKREAEYADLTNYIITEDTISSLVREVVRQHVTGEAYYRS